MTSDLTTARGQRSWLVVLVAAGALALAAVAGAFLVFQPDAATSSGAVQRLAQVLAGVGVPYDRASGVVEFGLNVALFVPGSFAAALLWPRVPWWQWVLLGFLISVGIEAVQGAFIPARDGQPKDLVSNTLGTALGAGAAVVLTKVGDRRAAPQDAFTV